MPDNNAWCVAVVAENADVQIRGWGRRGARICHDRCGSLKLRAPVTQDSLVCQKWIAFPFSFRSHCNYPCRLPGESCGRASFRLTMNENNQPLVVRSKLLPNNSAAEFVETRTGRLLGPEFSRPNGAEFAPVVDMFVNQDIVSSLRSVRDSTS